MKQTYTVKLDDICAAMLAQMSVDSRLEPEKLIASLVREVLIDDAIQHAKTNSKH